MMATDQMEEQSGQLDMQRYVDIVRRRYLYVIVPLFVGWAAVWGASWLLPTKYESDTQILVEQPTMPDSYVSPNINENLQDRLQSITQQILSRTRLASIIQKYHLYGNDDSASGMDARVDQMTKNINIELAHDTRNQNIT